jgi:hypothetical protein
MNTAEIFKLASCAADSRSVRRAFDDAHVRAGFEFVLPLDDDLFPRGHTACNHTAPAISRHDLYVAEFGDAVVLYDKYVGAFASQLHGRSWYGEGVSSRIENNTERDKLPGPKQIVAIVESRFASNRSGTRIDLIVD